MRRLGWANWQSWGDTSPGSRERKLLVLHSAVFNRITREATEARMGIG
ncbi:MAG: hypothetical protein WDN08_05355 [Rhizomicrobium sp.]